MSFRERRSRRTAVRHDSRAFGVATCDRWVIGLRASDRGQRDRSQDYRHHRCCGCFHVLPLGQAPKVILLLNATLTMKFLQMRRDGTRGCRMQILGHIEINLLDDRHHFERR